MTWMFYDQLPAQLNVFVRWQQLVYHFVVDLLTMSLSEYRALGSIQTGRANVKSTASLLYKNSNAARPVWMLRLINVFQNQNVVFYTVK